MINVKGGIVEAVDRLPVGLQVSLVPSLCPAMNFERKSAQSRVPGCFDDVRGAVQRSDVKRSVFCLGDSGSMPRSCDVVMRLS